MCICVCCCRSCSLWTARSQRQRGTAHITSCLAWLCGRIDSTYHLVFGMAPRSYPSSESRLLDEASDIHDVGVNTAPSPAAETPPQSTTSQRPILAPRTTLWHESPMTTACDDDEIQFVPQAPPAPGPSHGLFPALCQNHLRRRNATLTTFTLYHPFQTLRRPSLCRNHVLVCERTVTRTYMPMTAQWTNCVSSPVSVHIRKRWKVRNASATSTTEAEKDRWAVQQSCLNYT